MLLLLIIVLVLELESRRGEISNLFAKIKSINQLLRAPINSSSGKHNSTRVDEGKKSSNLLAMKKQGTNRSGEGGRRSCHVTQDLSYD